MTGRGFKPALVIFDESTTTSPSSPVELVTRRAARQTAGRGDAGPNDGVLIPRGRGSLIRRARVGTHAHTWSIRARFIDWIASFRPGEPDTTPLGLTFVEEQIGIVVPWQRSYVDALVPATLVDHGPGIGLGVDITPTGGTIAAAIRTADGHTRIVTTPIPAAAHVNGRP